jgi:peptidoglycan/xylan/chitin deacetylase (PgdA/CDA1 family)
MGILDPKPLTLAQGNATYVPKADVVPKWKAATAYAAGDKVVSPSGDIVSALTAFTSGASYNAANWTATGRAPSPAARVASVRSRGALCLHFDDGLPDQYTIAAPLVEQYGGRATFAICAGYSSNVNGTATKMSHANIKDLAARGHEIANHSNTHTDMTTQTATQRLAEWDTSQAFFTSTLGLAAPTSFVLPFSAANAAIEAESYLRFGRLFGNLTYPYLRQLRDIGTAQVHGRWGWASLTFGTGQKLMLELVRQAAASGSVLTAYTHNVNGTDTAGGITAAELEEVLALASSLGMAITTASEALPTPVSIADAGFEDANMIFWDKSGTDANHTATVVADAPLVGLPGANSLKISSTDATGVPYVLSKLAIPLDPDSSFTVSGRVRQEKSSTSATGAYIAIRQFNSSGVKVGSDAISTQLTATGSTPWTQLTATLTAPHVDCRMIKIMCAQNMIIGDSYFDHLHYGPTRAGAVG